MTSRMLKTMNIKTLQLTHLQQKYQKINTAFKKLYFVKSRKIAFTQNTEKWQNEL